jgi:hypothetical protein
MVNLIEELPDGVIGVEAHGTVTSEEYEHVLVPGEIDAFAPEDLDRVRGWVSSMLPDRERIS